VAHLRRIFLGFSLSLPVEADETVFKGVQIMHITLGLADFFALQVGVPREWRGSCTSLLLLILFCNDSPV